MFGSIAPLRSDRDCWDPGASAFPVVYRGDGISLAVQLILRRDTIYCGIVVRSARLVDFRSTCINLQTQVEESRIRFG
jgi:hypothetical protein